MAMAARAVPAGGRTRCEDCDIRNLAVCRSVDFARLPELAAIAHRRRIEPGRTLFEEGDPADHVYTLTTGVLKLYKLMSDGRRQVVGFLMPGDFLGLAFGRTYVYGAEAVTAVSACRFRRPRFLALLEEFPALEKEILARTSTELAAAQEQMLLLGRKTPRERLASFLLGLAARGGCPGRDRMTLPMGRADIADYLGLALETVSRNLTRLRKEGPIELPTTHELLIRDRAGLENLAGR